MYRLDKTQFAIKTFEQAENNLEYWLSKTPAERWAAAWYLTCCAYNLDYNNPPRLDKSQFYIRNHG